MTDSPIRRVGDTAVVHLAGEVDLTVADVLYRRISRETAQRSAVVLDLSAVTFLDSAGVRLVDDLSRACAERRASLRVVAPRGPARSALTLCGFPERLLAAHVEEALREPDGGA